MPRRPSGVSGGELSHATAPSSDGSTPLGQKFRRRGRCAHHRAAGDAPRAAGIARIGAPHHRDVAVIAAAGGARRPRAPAAAIGSVSISACSSDVVRATERRVRKPVSSADGDRDHADQHRDAESAPDPFAGAERALHRREHASADQERDREGRCGARGVGEQQQRRPGSRPAARRPSARGRGSGLRTAPTAVPSRRRAGTTRRSRLLGARTRRRREACAERDEWTRSASPRAGRQQRRSRKSRAASASSGRTGWPRRPAAADGRQRCDVAKVTVMPARSGSTLRANGCRPVRTRTAVPAGCKGSGS